MFQSEAGLSPPLVPSRVLPYGVFQALNRGQGVKLKGSCLWSAWSYLSSNPASTSSEQRHPYSVAPWWPSGTQSSCRIIKFLSGSRRYTFLSQTSQSWCPRSTWTDPWRGRYGWSLFRIRMRASASACWRPRQWTPQRLLFVLRWGCSLHLDLPLWSDLSLNPQLF